ncbi:hypothetical protein CGC21_27920 [Leishmania donovani]|uniref:Uncharacterized protein n=1 Tax=Leishmania donovani TaxID=5661 RepID=A0A504XYC4_LEIDO|nr:hypothetical protein CGC21_27920 [Leishmania donovani]
MHAHIIAPSPPFSAPNATHEKARGARHSGASISPHGGVEEVEVIGGEGRKAGTGCDKKSSEVLPLFDELKAKVCPSAAAGAVGPATGGQPESVLLRDALSATSKAWARNAPSPR